MIQATIPASPELWPVSQKRVSKYFADPLCIYVIMYFIITLTLMLFRLLGQLTSHRYQLPSCRISILVDFHFPFASLTCMVSPQWNPGFKRIGYPVNKFSPHRAYLPFSELIRSQPSRYNIFLRLFFINIYLLNSII